MNNPIPQAQQQIIARLARRTRLTRAFAGAIRGLTYGLALACLVTLAMLLGGARTDLALVALLVATSVAVGALVAALLPVDPLSLARACDRAAGAEDRFASALQLAADPHRERAALVLEDALQHVKGTQPRDAVPLRAPREWKWVALPAAAIVLSLWFAPVPTVRAEVPGSSIAAEDWDSLREFLRLEREKLPDSKDEADQDLERRLSELDALLAKHPDPKLALAELSKLRSDVERQRAANAHNEVRLQTAASAMRSRVLQQVAEAMKSGDYERAAKTVEELAARLAENQMMMDAEEFESAAQDLEMLSESMAANEDLSKSCEACSDAAAGMNQEQFAQAMSRFAEELKKNAEALRKSDRLSKAQRSLEELQRRLGQCSGQQPGQSFVRGPGGDRKGGLFAGTQPAEEWGGGAPSGENGESSPDMQNPAESAGRSTRLPTVSRDERAESGRDMKDVYADMIAQAEAELDIESTPVAYRDFLRRYFTAIRPQVEDPAAAEKQP